MIMFALVLCSSADERTMDHRRTTRSRLLLSIVFVFESVIVLFLYSSRHIRCNPFRLIEFRKTLYFRLLTSRSERTTTLDLTAADDDFTESLTMRSP